MWFNNTVIYHYELDKTDDLTTLLMEKKLKPCPPHARFIYGWLPVITDEFVQTIAGCHFICLGKEERILPRGVIHRLLAERIETLEAQQNRTIKRSEKAQIAEELEFELLPKAFCIQKRMPALLDTMTKRLLINTTSANQASQLTALLHQSIPGLHLEPLHCEENLAIRFAEWINHPATLPSSLRLASDCLLFSLDDEKKRFNCKGYELPAEEILTLLSQGLAVAEIALVWNERIQFTLTQDLVFKRLKCMEYLVDEWEDIRKLDDEALQQDAALMLLLGELRGLINDVLHALQPQTTQLPLHPLSAQNLHNTAPLHKNA